MRKHFLWVVAALLLATTSAWAQLGDPFGVEFPTTAGKKVDPSKQLRYRFKTPDGKPHPYGWARINGTEFASKCSKLEPGQVYSMWVVKADGSRAGVGETPFSFTAGENGEGNYTVRLPEPGFAIGDFVKLVVFHHPSGDANKVDDLEPVLEAVLAEPLPNPKEEK